MGFLPRSWNTYFCESISETNEILLGHLDLGTLNVKKPKNLDLKNGKTQMGDLPGSWNTYFWESLSKTQEIFFWSSDPGQSRFLGSWVFPPFREDNTVLSHYWLDTFIYTYAAQCSLFIHLIFKDAQVVLPWLSQDTCLSSHQRCFIFIYNAFLDKFAVSALHHAAVLAQFYPIFQR